MNTEMLLNSLLVSDTQSLGLIDITLALLLPFFLSFPATWVYQRVQASNNYSTAFIQSFFLFASLSSIMTMIIGNNIARAFGLIGALSIIRFRNALKSPIDAVYIFWSLAIGMACGTGYYLAAVFITLIVSILALSLYAIGYGSKSSIDSIVRVQIDNNNEDQAVIHIEEKLKERGIKFARINIIFDSTQVSKTYVYQVSADNEKIIRKIKNELEGIQGVDTIQYLNSTPSLFVA